MKLPTQNRGLKQSMKMAKISLRCILKDQIKSSINMLMTSETKINIFPHNQFFIEGFCSPCRLDCDSNSGGILLYVREDIPSNLIALENKPIGSLFVELNLLA